MEFEDEQDEEIELPYENSSQHKMPNAGGRATDAPPQSRKPRYRECLKNHAIGIGGHAVDGCGEFMPAGADGSLDALRCAACNCHRNFHRKDTDAPPHHHHAHPLLLPHHPQQFTPYYRTQPSGYLHVQQRPLALPSTSGGGGGQEDDDTTNMSAGSKKRFRTKFTQEQKDKMLELAEKLGWRIQKHDDDVIQQFCDETGVKRQVLKVWMHNNKHTLGKKP
ncbi:Zinc-finger homeodomain protein [Actinidia chinensis var. chinensis]|uniref:Zinc-finger homeodomain protein n=1 Tax=Actinidia chinensis var. chinensis TaxID=1590841 RepID=A0A2R6RDD0_ACTCC|nr:Zinc-finger homeodomain protein [Actinidia chinensis var. chinensis]